MKKLFYVDGGAGRVISAIPAFLKYHKLNPTEEWGILIGTWDFLYWGIPELQDRTYNLDTKGLFDNVVKNAESIITPEPYRNPAYFRQEISLVQAFDREINNTTDHSDLGIPKLIFNQVERLVAANAVNEVKTAQKKLKTIVIQPFGRGSRIDQSTIVDDESRSLDVKSYIALVKKLSQRYNMIFFGEPNYQLKEDTYAAKFTTDLRQWSAIINESDYFIGCDSSGQHIARATNTPGTVIFGSTYPINTSYPDFFQIIEKHGFKKYSPIRIAGLDSVLSNRLNEGLMSFDNQELNNIYNSIVADIEKKTKH